MNRYHFTITANGSISRTYIDAKNPMSAFNKAKRMFPLAEHIHLVRSERIIEHKKE
ncbi:MAG: hypothetical protein MJZ71_09095 [Bacteroidales bacterium]|nr:hypothetical protein [Bacteroidales bacterium]